MKQPHTWVGTYLNLEKRVHTCKARQVWRRGPFQWRRQWVRKMRCNKKQNGMLDSRDPTLSRVEVHPISSYNIVLGLVKKNIESLGTFHLLNSIFQNKIDYSMDILYLISYL